MKIKYYFSDRHNTLLPNNVTSDILSNNDSRILRKHDLKRAVILGSTYNLESSLEYVDKSGRKISITSRVVGLSEENVLFNNGRVIPIKTISKVVI